MSSLIARRLAGRIANISLNVGKEAPKTGTQEAEGFKNIWSNLQGRNGASTAPLQEIPDASDGQDYNSLPPKSQTPAFKSAAIGNKPAPTSSSASNAARVPPLAPPKHGALAASKEINRKIVQAGDVRGVLRVLESLRTNAAFNGVNCSTALHRLAKLAQDTAQGGLTASERQELSNELVRLNQMVVHNLHELDAQGLSNTLWANATMKRVLGAEALTKIAKAVEVDPTQVNPAVASLPQPSTKPHTTHTTPAAVHGSRSNLSAAAKVFSPSGTGNSEGASQSGGPLMAAVLAGAAASGGAVAAAEAPVPSAPSYQGPLVEDQASQETLLAMKRAGIKVTAKAAAPSAPSSPPKVPSGPVSLSGDATPTASEQSEAVELLGSDLWGEIASLTDTTKPETSSLSLAPSTTNGHVNGNGLGPIKGTAAFTSMLPLSGGASSVPMLAAPALLSSSLDGPEEIALRFMRRAAQLAPPEEDRAPTPQIWDAIVSQIDRKLDQYVPQAFANTLWALSTLDYHPNPAFLERLLRAAEVQLPDFAPQHLSISVYSCGTMNYHPGPSLMYALARRSEAVMEQFKPQELANLCWAFARLGKYDGALLERVAAACLSKISQFNRSQNIANVMWAFATLKFHPGQALMARFEEEACRHLAEYKPQEIACLIWAFAVLGEPCPLLLSLVQQEVLGRRRWLAEFKAQESANFLWGLALLDAVGPVWTTAMASLRNGGAVPNTFSTDELRQLYQAGLLCELSLPGALLAFPPAILLKAREAWAACLRLPRVSELHRDISRVLSLLGLDHVNDYITADGDVCLDIFLPGLNVGIEIDGPSHYCANSSRSTRPLGSTLARARLAASRVPLLLALPYSSYALLHDDTAKALFLSRMLEDTLAQAVPTEPVLSQTRAYGIW